MNTIARRLCAAAVLAAGLTSAAAVLPAHSQGSAAPPRLAAGVQPATDWAAPKTAYVVVNGTELFRTPAYDPSQQTGETLKRGERPQILAEANQGLWLLVGRNGQGIGYASRSLLCPVDLCRDIKG
jgi:hypothetical protein